MVTVPLHHHGIFLVKYYSCDNCLDFGIHNLNIWPESLAKKFTDPAKPLAKVHTAWDEVQKAHKCLDCWHLRQNGGH